MRPRHCALTAVFIQAHESAAVALSVYVPVWLLTEIVNGIMLSRFDFFTAARVFTSLVVPADAKICPQLTIGCRTYALLA